MKRPRGGRTRVVFWPFGLFGNPGAESGIGELSQSLVASMAEWEAEPGCRQHALPARTRIEVCDYLEVEDFLSWREDIRRRFEACLRARDFPVFVGGNHLVALPVYEAYSAMDARVCIVNFDAHLDAYDLASSKERLNHGNFLLHLAKGPRLAIVNVGHRDLTLAPARVREVFDRNYGIEAIAEKLLPELIAELNGYLREFDLVHFDIDLDVLDPSVLRAVGSPMPCGLAAQQLLGLLNGLWTEKLGGITISEYNGALDADGGGKHFVLWLLERLLLKRVEGGR